METHWADIASGKIVVLLEDESHLLWGDVCGFVWGKRNHAIDIPISNKRLRQTYYGAVNLLTHQFHLEGYPAGNASHTVAYVKVMQQLYPQAKLWFIWDGASYHRFAEMREYLAEINAGLEETDWRVTCILLAPNAPEQNPVEDIWLKGKNWLRKHFSQNKSFAQIKQCFLAHLKDQCFDSAKFDWYMPNPQLI